MVTDLEHVRHAEHWTKVKVAIFEFRALGALRCITRGGFVVIAESTASLSQREELQSCGPRFMHAHKETRTTHNTRIRTTHAIVHVFASIHTHIRTRTAYIPNAHLARRFPEARWSALEKRQDQLFDEDDLYLE